VGTLPRVMAKKNGTPITRAELRADLQAALQIALKRFATKDDLKRFATKDDLKRFATEDDLKESLKRVANEIGKIRDRLDRIESTMASRDQISTYQSAVDKCVTDNDHLWKKHLVHDERHRTMEEGTQKHETRLAALEKRDGA